MESVISVPGTPAFCSSQAVSRAPWRSGRVSSTSTLMFLPCRWAAMMTPRAVPWPEVASGPVLQCVSTVQPSASSPAPFKLR